MAEMEQARHKARVELAKLRTNPSNVFTDDVNSNDSLRAYVAYHERQIWIDASEEGDGSVTLMFDPDTALALAHRLIYLVGLTTEEGQ